MSEITNINRETFFVISSEIVDHLQQPALAAKKKQYDLKLKA